MAVENSWLPKLYVADVSSALGTIKSTAASSAPVAPQNPWFTGDNEVFGDLAPFCEPAWCQDNYSPYFRESHRKLQKFMRNWVESNILPFADEWEEAGEKRLEYLPRSYIQALGSAGILRALPGPSSWTKEVSAIPGVPALPAGIPEDEFDMFHLQIVWDEIMRCGYPGIIAGGTTGVAVGLPVLINFASQEIKEKVIPAALRGDVSMALAVTEPHAGSDIQGLLTTAKLSDDSKYFVVNGEKKWITNVSRAKRVNLTLTSYLTPSICLSQGAYATYFIAAVRTGGAGGAGISTLLLERGPGLRTRHVYTQTSVLAGTSYVMVSLLLCLLFSSLGRFCLSETSLQLEDLKVPVGNLLGQLNGGFKTIMSRFLLGTFLHTTLSLTEFSFLSQLQRRTPRRRIQCDSLLPLRLRRRTSLLREDLHSLQAIFL